MSSSESVGLSAASELAVPQWSLLGTLATLVPLDEDFPPIRELPIDPAEL
jgi:hypothetical protein